MKTKAETCDLLKSYILEIENETKKNVKAIRSDKGGEYLNSILKLFL